jgi:solute carrier family 25 oxoglutarate transporter 11
MVKVRIQLNSDKSRVSPFKTAKDIIAAGRFFDLYSGISAGLLRQAVCVTQVVFIVRLT